MPIRSRCEVCKTNTTLEEGKRKATAAVKEVGRGTEKG